MCGIGGVLRVYPPGESPPPHLDSIPESWLDALDDSIRHRGPDGAGRFRDRAVREDGTTVDVALVHRRLSIIDHEGGAQPMVHVRRPDGSGELLKPTPDGTIDATALPRSTDLVATAFNGCIYNHRELRTELEQQGHRFVTDHADTEVLLHGWRAWRDLLRVHLVWGGSMAATLIWDRRRGSLIAYRDFFGQKPLYLFCPQEEDDRIRTSGEPRLTYFASSPNAAAHLAPGTIREYPIKRWTMWGHDDALPAGIGCELGPNDLEFQPDRSEIDSKANRKIDEDRRNRLKSRFKPKGLPLLTSELKSLNSARLDPVDQAIRECVEDRLDCDTPIACLLSGGVDSSLITHYAKEALGRITTVAVKMPIPGFDESHHAEAVATHLGTNHITVPCETNAAEDLVHLITQLGLPFGDSSLLPTYWACKAASQVAPVLLTGDGGDELFLGYDRHFIPVGQTVSFLGFPIALLTPLRAIPDSDPRSKWSRMRRLVAALRRNSYSSLLAIFQHPDARRLFNGGKLPSIDLLDLDETPQMRAAADLDFVLPGDYLRKVDTASMAVPVEIRAPFLDWELLISLQPITRWLDKGGRKGFLRAIARRHLPDHIVDRPKRGFAIPIGEWFRSDFGSLRQLLYDHLESADPFPGLADAGVPINMGYVHQMLREHDRAGEASRNPWHGRDHSQRLYMLLVLSIWAKWLDRTRQDRAKT